jgi:hypothetical protein
MTKLGQVSNKEMETILEKSKCGRSDLSKQPEGALRSLLDEINEAERTDLRHIEYLRSERARILTELERQQREREV